MSRNIPAIFNAGVFRPLGPVDLAEGTQVSVYIEGSVALPPIEVDAETTKALIDFLDRMESLPENSPPDSFFGRDHDRILYGG
ncbi:MAG TPA: antitoxin family protein [Pirellulales bacterium]|jgi:predicted DNA-binding antitoxin AbrB/MazE fold protein